MKSPLNDAGRIGDSFDSDVAIAIRQVPAAIAVGNERLAA